MSILNEKYPSNNLLKRVGYWSCHLVREMNSITGVSEKSVHVMIHTNLLFINSLHGVNSCKIGSATPSRECRVGNRALLHSTVTFASGVARKLQLPCRCCGPMAQWAQFNDKASLVVTYFLALEKDAQMRSTVVPAQTPVPAPAAASAAPVAAQTLTTAPLAAAVAARRQRQQWQ